MNPTATPPEAARAVCQWLGSHVEWTVRSLQHPILAVTERIKAPERVLMSGQPSGDGPKQIEWARQALEQAGFGVVADIQPGKPEAVIGHAIQSKRIDLLVMGAYTRPGVSCSGAARPPALLLR